MTAQLTDKLRYRGDDYWLIAVEHAPLFSPDSLLRLKSVGSGCWRGYVCHYEVEYKTLLLRRLLASAEEYPVIDGVEPGPDKYSGLLLRKHFSCYPFNRPLNYTGGIVAGNGVARDFTVNMGFQKAIAYETVWELLFKHGELANAIDRSEEVEMLRELLKEEGKRREKPPERDDTGSWVDTMFSLSYKDKYPF